MAKIKEKESALQLRKEGTSIKQIARLLSVSPSTVSVWCRDIQLSKEAISRLTLSGNDQATAALIAYSQAKRETRENNTKNNYAVGAKLIGGLSDRDVLCIGLGLYWGEGYKNGNREFGFTNSDPAMIQFYIHWLQTVFNIPTTDLTLRVSINDQHTNRIDIVEKYWAKITNVPLNQFTKSSLIKTLSKKHYSNHHRHYGTLRIKVKLGSDYREQILGAIEHIKI